MKKNIRPVQSWVVTIQLALVLCFTIWNLIRSLSSFLHWDTLSTYYGQPAYIFTSGFIWTIAGFVMLWLIWKAKQATILTGRLLLLAFLIYAWVDRFLIQASPAQNFLFQLGIEFFFILLYLIPFSLEEGKAYYIKEIQ